MVWRDWRGNVVTAARLFDLAAHAVRESLNFMCAQNGLFGCLNGNPVLVVNLNAVFCFLRV